jgi:hypothetical protein
MCASLLLDLQSACHQRSGALYPPLLRSVMFGADFNPMVTLRHLPSRVPLVDV